MLIRALLKRPARVFYGWWVLAACSLFYGLGMPLSSYAFSVTFLPISQELGFSRARLSLVVSLSRGEGAFEGIASGWLIDRLGPRFMMMVGMGLAGVGYILLSQAHSYVSFLFFYLGIITIGTNAGLLGPVLAAVNNWFRRRRALAMSITTTISSGGGAFIVPAYAAIVLAYGWRTGVTLVGLVMLVVLVPLALIVRRSPESMGLRPDGDTAEDEAKAVERGRAPEVDFTVKEALRTLSYWLMVLSIGLRLFALGPMFLHFIPILVWKGMSQQQAAYVMGLMLFWTIPSRPFIGWLGDRFSKPKLLALGMILAVISLLLLNYGQATWVIWMGAALFGLMEGFPPINYAILGDYFGRRNFATLRGWMQFFTTPGSMAAPFLAGLIYDRTQSYELVLLPAAALFGSAGVVYALLRPPRRPLRADSQGS